MEPIKTHKKSRSLIPAAVSVALSTGRPQLIASAIADVRAETTIIDQGMGIGLLQVIQDLLEERERDQKEWDLVGRERGGLQKKLERIRKILDDEEENT